MIAKVSVALLFFVELARSAAMSGPAGCCGQFSQVQENQLKFILKSEAHFLQQQMSMMCPNKTTAKWVKINTAEVCFGAKSTGEVRIPSEGFISAMKLVHRSGRITSNNMATKWGCGDSGHHTKIGVFVTTSSDKIVYPCHEHFEHGAHEASVGYVLPNFTPNSDAVVFSDFQHPLYVASGQELRLWLGKRLASQLDSGDSGQSCVDVYVWFA